MIPSPFQGYDYTGPPGIGLSGGCRPPGRAPPHHPRSQRSNHLQVCHTCTRCCFKYPGVDGCSLVDLLFMMAVHGDCSRWPFMMIVYDDRSWWLFMMTVHDDCSSGAETMFDHHCHGWSSLSWLIIIIMVDHHYHVWSSLSCLIIIVKKNIFMIFFRFLYGNIFKIKYS